MRAVGTIALSLTVAACGGGGGGGSGGSGSGGGTGGVATTYSVAVDVQGLSDAAIVLLNGGTDALQVTVDGRHTFGQAMTAGQRYSISVQQQPFTQVCIATNGAGVVNAASPPVVAVQCLARVVGTATGLWIVTRATTNGFEQYLYARSRATDLNHFRIRPVDGGLDPAGPSWSPFASSNFIVSFEFSPDGSAAYADDLLGNIHAASIRDSDGALVQSWSGVLGQYIPTPPVLFGYARPSPDGQMLYRSFNAVIGGVQTRDLWVGSVGPTGLSVASGLPFALGSDGVISFGPGGRFFARANRAASQIEVYRTFSSTIQTPQLVGSYPLLLGSNGFGLAGEEKAGRWLWEVSAVSVNGGGSASPQAAVHRWRQDGSIESLGAPLTGVSVSGEIAASVCTNGETSTQRISVLESLPATAADYRYVVQRQDTRCRSLGGFVGPLVDTRALALFLVRVTNGRAESVSLAVDSLPGWSDLGIFGAAHPAKPWLYIGSKFSQRVYAYSVDPSTGAVQPLAGSPFDAFAVPPAGAPSQPTLIMDPGGRYLYLSQYPESSSQPRLVHAFSIDQATGALTAVATYSLP
jgi:hypothetical protein